MNSKTLSAQPLLDQFGNKIGTRFTATMRMSNELTLQAHEKKQPIPDLQNNSKPGK